MRTDFAPATKSRKSLNVLNNLKPWSPTLQRHIRCQTIRTIPGQKARFIRSDLVASGRLSSLSTLSAKTLGKSPWKWVAADEQSCVFLCAQEALITITLIDLCPLPHHQSATLSTIFCRGVLEREVNNRPYNKKEAPKAAIKDTMTNMDRDSIAKSITRFRSGLEKVVSI